MVGLPPGAFNGQGDTLVRPGPIDGALGAAGVLVKRRVGALRY